MTQANRNYITYLMAEGRLTLQVGEYEIVMDGDDFGIQHSEDEDPEDWFQYLKQAYEIKNFPEEFVGTDRYNMRLCLGKEQGFRFLTRKGFDANKEILKAAWERRTRENRYDWAFVERYAEFFFQQVELATETYRQKQSAKLIQYRID